MKVLFIIQGEGRGHLSQAIALKEILLKHNFEVVCSMIGKSQYRQIPQNFIDNFDNVIFFNSPNFIQDKNNKHYLIWRSIIINFFKIPKYLKEINKIKKNIRKYDPDIIINFYEPLVGLMNLIYPIKKIKIISIAHQFLYNHPLYTFPKHKFTDIMFIKILNFFCGYGSYLKLAISFMPYYDYNKTYVIPPLLRNNIINQKHKVTSQDYILIYLLNKGYINDILNWHHQNPNIKIVCFTDEDNNNDEVNLTESFKKCRINSNSFIEYLIRCKALISTAGYETLAEAMYLNKQTLAIPVENHFEQKCNAFDLIKINGGITSTFFDIDKLLNIIDKKNTTNIEYSNWVKTSENKIIKIFEKIRFK